ncbi:glycosyltransferase [Microvirgula aerodenitrificans]|uniref:glycosyltransferase n=1 Tax=Microvirgula aerodenitrificans TaxID=57480 RepID=UPI0028E36EAA|nr:glycosyltransferase [Microvirgula aerodenitrificans]
MLQQHFLTAPMTSPYIIEIVPVDRGWILETMARAIERQAALSPERFNVRVVDAPTDKAELTFFLPESAYRPLKHSTTVTYLAHKEDHPAAAALFERVAKGSDYCITSSTKYQRVLEQDGAHKVFKVHLGVNTELFTPRLRLGVVGRTYHTGRKGEALLAELASLPLVELRFTGEGWPHPAGYYATADLVRFYRDIDYLLIPSLIEGGPVPLLEALAAGCPVIAPSDIGLVEDFPHIAFKRGDAADLRRVVDELLRQKLTLRESVLDRDWRDFARRHLNIFADLIDERRRSRPTSEAVTQPVGNGVRVLLITHGTEDAAKGGPSTRVRFIVSQLQAAGHFAATHHNLTAAVDLADFDVVHVFNSWPPQTAQECLAQARKAGKTVIFSPIALDLSDWPIYRQMLESAFVSGKQAVVESVVGQLPRLAPVRRYSGENADLPFEGIPGHFEALRKCCALADYVVFLSEQERDFLAALGARTDRGTLIRNGVSDAFAGAGDPELFRGQHGLGDYVLCVGRVEFRKNQALLAMAMRDLDVPLVLIGDVGDPGYLDHVRMLGGSNLYHFTRIDDKALLASAYAGAAVFVLPSWCEGAPLAALEAGLTGVPLVLSDRSSEREYFGGLADYVAPTDPAAMRAAILRTLERRESPAVRAERAALLQNRYSETEHVRQTLDLYYRATVVERSGDNQELIIDVSALLHSLRVGGHLTGVPLTERHLVAELVAMHPVVRCVAYNDFKGRFIEIAYRDLEHFDPVAFNRRYWFSDDAESCDMRLEFTLAPSHAHLSPKACSASTPKEAWYVWSARLAGLLAKLGMSSRSISRIGRLARHLRILGNQRISLLSSWRDLLPVKEGNLDFSDAGRYLVKTSHSRQSLIIHPGSRILTLGQSWLSNEPLLDSLIELACGHDLEAYVYDISYVSGAHYSGWDDNADRQRRLTKLLAHCRTVFTESRMTEAELAKFASSRSLCYQIVRTGLRGKVFPAPKTKFTRLSKKPFIIYVSSFNSRKNHDFLVNVWKDLVKTNEWFAKSGIKLLLVGEIQGESKYENPDYQSALRKLNVEVITDADDACIGQYFSQCLFTVYPSLQEGWGIPVQESLANGKICIASNTVPAAVEIGNAALIKIPPNDFFGWREAIYTWASNDVMRSAFETKAYDYIQPGWDAIANSIMMKESIREGVD